MGTSSQNISPQVLALVFDKYNDYWLLPVTMDFRYSMLKNRISPVIIASFGYDIGLPTENQGFLHTNGILDGN